MIVFIKQILKTQPKDPVVDNKVTVETKKTETTKKKTFGIGAGGLKKTVNKEVKETKESSTLFESAGLELKDKSTTNKMSKSKI